MLWAWIKRERTARGWTQAELSARAGISTQAISAGERGNRTDVTGETLVKLAGAFGLTTDGLLIAAGVTHLPEHLAALKIVGVGQEILMELAANAQYLTNDDWEDLVARARRRAAKHQGGQPIGRKAGERGGDARIDEGDQVETHYPASDAAH